MAARYSFIAYKYQNDQDHLVFETDFPDTVFVKPDLLDLVSRELSSFASTPEQGSSELMIDMLGMKFVLNRATESKWEPELEEEIDSPKLISSSSDLLSELHQITTEGLETDQVSIKQQLKDLLGDKGDTYVTNLEKMEATQTQLDLQRKVDDAHTEIKEIKDEISFIDEKLGAVESMAKRETEITTTLTKYAGKNLEELNQQGEQYKGEVKNARLAEFEIGKQDVRLLPPKAEVKKPRIMPQTKVMGILAAITLVLTVIAFLVSSSVLILVTGVLFALLQLIFFGITNYLPAEVVTLPFTGSEQGQNSEVAGSESPEKTALAKFETFFVDKAWMEALEHDLAQVKKSISQQLGGEDYEVIKTKKINKQKQVDSLQELIDSHAGKDIPPEEYLKKRREVDLLKIERSRLESEFRDLENAEEVQELVDKLTKSEDSEQEEEGELTNFARSINPTYTGARFHDAQIELTTEDNPEWSTANLDESELTALVLLKVIQDWESSSKPPLLIVDLFNKLAGNARNAVDARINQARNLGQIIIISKLA